MSEENKEALPAESSGYIRMDCYGGLNQMRRDFCDGVGIACLLNVTHVLPKFEQEIFFSYNPVDQVCAPPYVVALLLENTNMS
ncbi:hypothetical protein CsSME_00024287 [Camellia sinensis var. sinensis]